MKCAAFHDKPATYKTGIHEDREQIDSHSRRDNRASTPDISEGGYGREGTEGRGRGKPIGGSLA